MILNLHLLLNKSPTPQGLWRYFIVPDDGYEYAFLRHDWQRADLGYKPRSAGLNDKSPNISLPETVHMLPFDKKDFLFLTPALQEFFVTLFAKANPSMAEIDMEIIKAQFANATKRSVAFTDRHAWDSGYAYNPVDPSKNYAFYPLGWNLYNPLPIAWKVGISCGGNLVRILEKPNIVEAIDPLALPTVDDIWNKPWLLHWGTEENGRTTDKLNFTQEIDGQSRTAWRVTPFPQVRNIEYKRTGMPYGFFGYGGKTRVEAGMLLPAKAGTLFSPYVPQLV